MSDELSWHVGFKSETIKKGYKINEALIPKVKNILINTFKEKHYGNREDSLFIKVKLKEIDSKLAVVEDEV